MPSSRRPAYREGTGETISVGVALDEWLPTVGVDRVDVVKIDVEGAELRALRGAENLLRRHRPVLIVECNPLPLRRFQSATAADMIELLHEIYGPITRSSTPQAGFTLSNRSSRPSTNSGTKESSS